MKFYYFFFLLLFSLSTRLFAQNISGNIEGRVTDSSGVPLQRVNISLQSESLQGMRGSATNDKGSFGILFLPVGTYRVKISSVGYRDVMIENVQIALGKTTSLGEIKLEQKVITLPEVSISGDKQIIDPSSTTYGGNINPKDYEQLPLDRDYKSMISLLPQANASFYGDGVNIGGSTGFENKYFVDGVEVTDPLFNVFSTYLPYNFINEIELKAGGYEAEFQSALGGVVNVVTNSGTNEFHGSAFGFYSSNNFTGNKELGLLDPTQGDFSNYDIGFSLGGPIIKDKIWFFAAYNPTFENHEVSIPSFGIDVDKTIRHSFAGKLNWHAFEQLRFNLTITGDPTKRDAVGRNVLDPPASLSNPDTYLQDISEGGVNLSLNGSYSVGQNILLNGFIARVIRHDTGDPATEKGKEPKFVNEISNTWAGGVGVNWDSFRYSNIARFAFSILSTYHQTSAGIQYKVSGTDNRYNYHSIVLNNDTIYTEYFGKGFQTVSQRMPSFFVQDTWKVFNSLRATFGIRWDWQYIIGSDNKVDQTVTVPMQPRVGIAFIPDSKGENKIYVSFGRYSQELSLGSGMAYSDQGYDSLYKYPQYQDPRISRDNAIPDGSQFTIAPEVENLKGQYYDQLSLGYERLIWQNFKISVQGLYRTFVEALEDGYSLSENRWITGNPGKYPLQYQHEAMRDYAALIISMERRGDERFNFLVSYVLSRDYGNYEGLFDAFYHSEFPNLNMSFDNPFEVNNNNGLLPNDRTHVFKFSGSYKFSFGLTAGMTFLLESGTPLSEYTTGSYYTGIKFLSQRGSVGRTPTIWDLSARFTYQLTLMNFFSSRLILDIFHIGSQQKPVDINQRKYFVDESGNPTDPNPNYGQAFRYQQPMAMRLGMEINF